MSDIYSILKSPRHRFSAKEVGNLFNKVDERRVRGLSEMIREDIRENLPKVYGRRKALPDYRANPYVLLATAHVMELGDPERFANFLFNSKLAMGLETSFGKLVERAFVGGYPCGAAVTWSDPPEKLAEFAAEKAAEGRAAKAAIRNGSIWREIDKSVVFNKRRYLTSIKSGPNTINDTQVQGMVDAISQKHARWWEQSQESNEELDGLDIVIGLTYGTERTTNNKDNQILAKLLDKGFREECSNTKPGVLIDSASGKVRVYRRVGQSFWAWIGNPENCDSEPQVFLEILLALSIALGELLKEGSTLEEGINERLDILANALRRMKFSKDSLPNWADRYVSDDQLFWFATAVSAFYDEGI
ncbi:MAG: hypothetical protein JJU26_03905 [Oceanicaulis sp.]|uniref:PmeII family type II restriction endonuclease n=1 Tax=Glycocaulis sp. TaxID=1969725 RepID=UPI0025BD5E1E|nr:PmeII family type II restriction endonuclease [Glycocaulis sp.]MCC5980846.1 hypothetical protein [Oceanicaulis sp.]MCH8520567.1 hypothetical protein [Glycocaulis sp.]